MQKIELFDFKVIPLYDTVRNAKISDEEYFSSKYKKYISNSKLKLIDSEENGSPNKYKTGLKTSFNPSFLLGSAVHELVLQPEESILTPDPFHSLPYNARSLKRGALKPLFSANRLSDIL